MYSESDENTLVVQPLKHEGVDIVFYLTGGLIPDVAGLCLEMQFTALDVHAQLEDNVFYPAYETMTGKNGTQLVADSRLAHEHVKELLIELQDIDLDEETFEAKFQELRHTVEQHVAQEEDEMFPEAEQILADQLGALRDDMMALKQQRMTVPRQ